MNSSTSCGLVSVIVPFFNDSQWLLEALDSIVVQTYPNWECIIIDDGSDIVHSDVAKAFVSKHFSKFTYIDHPAHANLGVTISRNTGIAASCGAYIAFLDADDKWLPAKLELQMELFANLPNAVMLCEASWFWYSWANKVDEDMIVEVGAAAGKLYPPGTLSTILYPLGHGAPPCPSSIMIERSAFERSGGFEPAFSGIYQLYEDQALLAKIYLNEWVYVSGLANNYYRKRNNSMSSAARDLVRYKKVRLFFLDWLRDYIAQHQIHNSAITQCLIVALYDLFA